MLWQLSKAEPGVAAAAIRHWMGVMGSIEFGEDAFLSDAGLGEEVGTDAFVEAGDGDEEVIDRDETGTAVAGGGGGEQGEALGARGEVQETWWSLLRELDGVSVVGVIGDVGLGSYGFTGGGVAGLGLWACGCGCGIPKSRGRSGGMIAAGRRRTSHRCIGWSRGRAWGEPGAWRAFPAWPASVP